MQKKYATQQAINEFISDSRHLRNLPDALSRIAKLKSDVHSSVRGMLKMPGSLLVSVPANFSADEVESKALASIKPKEALQAVSEKMGFGAIRVNSRSRYDVDNDILALSPRGALAVSLFSKLSLDKGTCKETVISIIRKDSSLPANASPKAIAEALFFAHIAANGLDGALASLYLGDAILEKLKAGGRVAEAVEIRDSLYMIQLDFLKSLY